MKTARGLLSTLGLVVAGSMLGVLTLLAMPHTSTSPQVATLPSAQVATPGTLVPRSIFVATAAVTPNPALTWTPRPTPSPRPTMPPTVAPTITATIGAGTPGSAESVAQKAELLALVNQLRTEHGCPPLQIEPQLEQIAQAHAEDIRDTERIDHVGSDGATYQNRLDRAGYPYQLYGENIAAYSASARDVMQSWTEGDENPNGPHRQNILNCLYTEAGIGLALGDNGVLYWSLDLANRRP